MSRSERYERALHIFWLVFFPCKKSRISASRQHRFRNWFRQNLTFCVVFVRISRNTEFCIRIRTKWLFHLLMVCKCASFANKPAVDFIFQYNFHNLWSIHNVLNTVQLIDKMTVNLTRRIWKKNFNDENQSNLWSESCFLKPLKCGDRVNSV